MTWERFDCALIRGTGEDPIAKSFQSKTRVDVLRHQTDIFPERPVHGFPEGNAAGITVEDKDVALRNSGLFQGV